MRQTAVVVAPEAVPTRRYTPRPPFSAFAPRGHLS
jgi:hypothetical protein